MVSDFLRGSPSGPDERGSRAPVYEVTGPCPICGEVMNVVRLQCGNCTSSLDGNFSLGRLYRLSPAQRHFVELFLKHGGNKDTMAEELAITPAMAGARLNEIIRALGFTPQSQPESGPAAGEKSERQRILDELAAGRITAGQAAEQLRRLADWQGSR